jgi:hypothetical protein
MCTFVWKMQKYGPIICIVSNHVFLDIKSLKTLMKFVRVSFSIIRQSGQSNNRFQFYHNMIYEIITPLQPCKLLIPT